MRLILKEIKKSDELMYSLENISHDDKCSIEDYTDKQLVAEAKYVLSCFYEGGHINNDALIGENEDDVCNRAWALREVRALKRIIKRFDKE